MKLTEEQIEDKVSEWHNSDNPIPLHEYIGITWEEYKEYVQGWANTQVEDTTTEWEKKMFADGLISPMVAVHINQDGSQQYIEPGSKEWWEVYNKIKGNQDGTE